LVKPLFFQMDPERAHHLVIAGLSAAGKVPGMETMLRQMYGVGETADLSVDVFGIHFPNPIGLAAGLDKNAQAIRALSRLGFGFAEVGTVTPRPQPGNERPRLFRLPEDEALINRMGFNNDGADAVKRRLSGWGSRTIPIAVNIGKNKTTPNERAEEDYRACIRTLYPKGDFFVVNVSSPNTPELRKLQHGNELAQLLDAVMDEMNKQCRASGGTTPKPVLVKIAPDMDWNELDSMLETILSSGVSGIIATNTTVARQGLSHAHARETGGLSGKPLRKRSTEVIRHIYRSTGGRLPIIGTGGIFSAADAYEKIKAGAVLVEVYTGFIYRGPGLIRDIHAGLREMLKRDGFQHIMEAVGSETL
jgi:dihydroorotate dehydrogenase